VIHGSGSSLLKGTGFFSDGVHCVISVGRNGPASPSGGSDASGTFRTKAAKPAFLEKQIKWNQGSAFPICSINDQCAITCVTGKTFIGRATFPVSSLPLNHEIEKLHQLYATDGEAIEGAILMLRLKVVIEDLKVVRSHVCICANVSS
jgi:hypothetical protein